MSKASDAGKAFIAGVLAKLPEAQRGQVQTVFDSADAVAALEVIGTGALAQPEINRQLDDLRKKATDLDDLRERNNTWYAENKAALEDYLKIKPEFDTLKAGGGGGGGGEKPPVAGGPTKEEIAAALDQRDRSFAGALALSMDLSAKHMHMFAEPLNTTELLSDPKLGTVVNGQTYGLMDAYNSKHGTRVQEKLQATENARIQKLVDEGVAEKLKGLPQNQQHPFPLRDPSPSPLDALSAERKPADYSVDSAVAEYERLQGARNGAPA